MLRAGGLDRGLTGEEGRRRGKGKERRGGVGPLPSFLPPTQSFQLGELSCPLFPRERGEREEGGEGRPWQTEEDLVKTVTGDYCVVGLPQRQRGQEGLQMG